MRSRPALAAFSALLLACGDPGDPSPRTDPTPEELLGVLAGVSAAQASGNIAAYEALRDPEALAEHRRLLAAQGVEWTPETLRRFAAGWPDVSTFHDPRATTRGDWSRLVLVDPPGDLEPGAYLVVLFRRVQGTWRLVRPVTLPIDPGTKPGLDERIEELGADEAKLP